MNQIDAALYAKLTAFAGTALLSSGTAVYCQIAPEGATEPYIIFGQQSRVPARTFGTAAAWEDCLYLVKAVTTGHSGKTAGSIATLIDQTLNDGSLSISGYSLMKCRRESGVDYPEVGPAGEVYQHRGALYRIWADPA